MKAIVMAGGLGSRLYPLTVGRPKPMIPLVNKPVLGHILNLLKRHNFSEVIITARYLSHKIQEYFGDGRHWGVKLHYCIEDTPLGTAGGVKNAQPYLDDQPFLVISGDALTDINLSKLAHFHHQKQSMMTMALKRVSNPSHYGVVVTDAGGHVQYYLEKPGPEQIISNTVNTGIYVVNPEILDLLESQTAYDFSYDVFPNLLAQNIPFFGKVMEGYWCDIGTIQSYTQATFDVLAKKVRGLDLGHYMGHNLWVGGNVDISPKARLSGPLYLGNGVKILGGARIQGPAVIGDHTTINRGAHVERAIVNAHCHIGRGAYLKQTIIPERTIISTKVVPIEAPMYSSQQVPNYIFA